MENFRNPRTIAFIALMGALGNVMFVVSQTIFKNGPIALDLSHIGTFIAAVYGGPLMGLITGVIVGIGPGLYFGYLGGSLGLLGLIGLPVGKAMTGLTVGYLGRILRVDGTTHASWKVPIATLLGYIPEALFTILFFESFIVMWFANSVPYIIGPYGSMNAYVAFLMAKAWFEIGILTAFMSALVANRGFNQFARRVFPKPYAFSKVKLKQPK
jgi:hypothetical protein